jgi:site-specific recombinase XerD
MIIALRHTFGTRLGEADVNLKKIARLIGHTTTKHTEIYVHATDAGLMSAMEIAALPSADRTSAVELRVAERG